MTRVWLTTDDANPQLPAQVTADADETIAGTEDRRAVTPEGLNLTLPFVPAKDTMSADDITALSADLSTNYGGGTIDLRPGTYTFGTDAISLASGTWFKGNPGVIMEMTDATPSYPIQAVGTEGTAVAFTANQAQYSFTVTLPTGQGANFAVDDIIGFRSNAIVLTSVLESDGHPREFHQILGISTDTLTLDGALMFAYNTADTAEFFKVTPVTDVTISDVTMRWAPGSTVFNRGPILRYALRSHFRNMTVINGPGLTIYDSIHCSATNTVVDGSKQYETAYLASSYGVIVQGSGHGTYVNGGTFRSCRHATSTMYHAVATDGWVGPYDTKFSNLIGWGGTASLTQFDTHPFAIDTQFIGNQAIGATKDGHGGFQDRGVRTTITGNTVRQANRGVILTVDSKQATVISNDFYNINAGTTPTGVLCAGADALVKDNRFRSASRSVVNGSAATNTIIEGNVFQGTYLYAISDQASADNGQKAIRNTYQLSSAGSESGVVLWWGESIDETWLGGGASTFRFVTPTNARMTKSVGTPTTVAYAASYAPKPTQTNCVAMTLTGNVSVSNPTTHEKVKGCPLRFIFTQDGTGGRTVTWGSEFKDAWTPDTTAARVNVIDFQFDGTNWVQVSTAVNLQ